MDAAFTIQGYDEVVGHEWRGQIRRVGGNRLMGAVTVAATLATVVEPNDSVRIAITVPAALSVTLRPGPYFIEVEDVTIAKTWASGILHIERDSSHA